MRSEYSDFVTPDEMFLNKVVAASGLTQVGKFYVGNRPYFGLLLTADTNHWSVVLTFSSTPDLTDSFGSLDIHVRNGSPFSQAIPVLGPYVSISATPSAASSQLSIAAWHTQTPNAFRGRSLFSPLDDVLISTDLVSVGAGGTRTDTAVRTVAGWAYWYANMENGISWRFRLRAIDKAGTTTLLDYISSDQRTAGRLVFLPAMTVQVLSENFDGSARNAFVTLLAKPFLQ